MKIPERKRAQEIPEWRLFSSPIVGNWRLEDAVLDQLNNAEVDDEGIGCLTVVSAFVMKNDS